MPDPILSEEELRAEFEANLAKQKKLTKEEREAARKDFDHEMAERDNNRFDVQKHYDQGRDPS